MEKIIYVFIMLCFSCHQDARQKLTIATAANMQFAMEALSQSFTDGTGIECEIIIGSSGKLTAQVQQGAPFDIFISADMKYPTALYNSGMTIDTPKVYAYGNLVLWTTVKNIHFNNFENCISLLASDTVRHIALANPKTAPYGEAAIEVLNHYKLFGKVEHKLVFGESIAQTNQFITTQAAEVGFTAKSVVLSPKMSGQGRWAAIDSDIYTPIAQGVVVLKQAKNRLPNAKKFYNYLFSEKAKEILNNFGYDVEN